MNFPYAIPFSTTAHHCLLIKSISEVPDKIVFWAWVLLARQCRKRWTRHCPHTFPMTPSNNSTSKNFSCTTKVIQQETFPNGEKARSNRSKKTFFESNSIDGISRASPLPVFHLLLRRRTRRGSGFGCCCLLLYIPKFAVYCSIY